MASSDEGLDDEDQLFDELFRIEDNSNDKFYFISYSIDHLSEDDSTSIIFHYSYAYKTHITSSLSVPLVIDEDDTIVSKLVFNIGMCVMMWYWMGYATKQIVISSALQANESDLRFWNHHMNHMMSEFAYVHKLPFLIEVISEDVDQVSNLSASLRVQSMRESAPITRLEKAQSSNQSRVLLGVGGGKDSVVAWHLLHKQGYQPLLVYIADSPTDYPSNNILHEVIGLMANSKDLTDRGEVYVATHDFHCEAFEKYSRSYYKPCGHPWAALVLLDTALVSFPL
jgi:uncharacterized protein YrzB (UPF0473 family)